MNENRSNFFDFFNLTEEWLFHTSGGKCDNLAVEFSRNTQSWQCWHFCIALKLKMSRIEKPVTSILIESTMTNVNLP